MEDCLPIMTLGILIHPLLSYECKLDKKYCILDWNALQKYCTFDLLKKIHMRFKNILFKQNIFNGIQKTAPFLI